MKTKSLASPKLDGSYLRPDNFFDSFLKDNNKYSWGPEQTYPAGTEIIKQDTPANAVYLIMRGKVKLTYMEKGGTEVIVGFRHRHWLIGASSVLLNKQYTFTITTLTNCVLRCISAEGFLISVKINEQFSQYLLQLLSLEIFCQGMNIVLMGSMSAIERIKRFLYEMIREIGPFTERKTIDYDKPIKITIPLKFKEMAQSIAVTPEHFSRLLKTMEEQGIITRNKGHLIIKNPARLLQDIKISI